MTSNWNDAKARRPRSAESERRVAEHMERMLREVRAQRLADLREERGLTQTAVAQAMDVGQPWVSKIERGEIEANGLATIRSYVEALGGRLEVHAAFDDRSVVVG